MLDGHNGQLELTENAVIIRRKGVLAFMTQGLKGEKSIKLSEISSVQFRKAGPFVNGYIQFAYRGGMDAKGGVMEATKDENTVMFRSSQNAAFENFRAEVERRMTVGVQTRQAHSSLDDLERLASLRDKGVITEDEFQAKKKQILGL